MSTVTGGEVIVKTLLSAGVNTAFGINGAHVDDIYQAALDHGLRIIDTRHEMNAGHAAEGYARLRNALGVAVLTAGGGFTNGLTSIANAFLDRTPVLYLAGSGPLAMDETNTLQSGIDQVAIATPITKWAHRVTRPELLPRMLARAIRTALAAPRGPVLLDIPWDVLTAHVPEPDWSSQRLSAQHSAAPPDTVERVVDLLSAARRPVLLVGSEIARAGAAGEVCAFAEQAGIPLLADYEGLGAIAGSSVSFGLIQSLFGLEAEAPDVVVMLGLRFGLTTAHGSGALIPTSATVVHIDPDAGQLGNLQPVDLAVAADAGQTVSALRAEWERRGVDGAENLAWFETLRAHRSRRASAVAAQVEEGDRIHPYLAVRTIADSLPEGSVVVADGALTYLWLSEVIGDVSPRAYLCHGYLGSMGVGLGVALGAQAAVPSAPVVLVTGDGAIGYSLGEFDALVRAGLPVVVIVLNNRAWGATLHAQQFMRGEDRIVNNRLENGDYSAAAAALGAEQYAVRQLDEIGPAITNALAGGRPACIEVHVSLDPVPPEERVIMGGSPF